MDVLRSSALVVVATIACGSVIDDHTLPDAATHHDAVSDVAIPPTVDASVAGSNVHGLVEFNTTDLFEGFHTAPQGRVDAQFTRRFQLAA